MGISLGMDTLESTFLDKHASRLRALVAGDDPAALEHVDQAPGPRVADSEPALEKGYRRGLCLHDDVDRPVEERVLVGVEVLVAVAELFGRRLRRLKQRLVQLLAALGAALLDEQRDLLLGHVGALHTLKA